MYYKNFLFLCRNYETMIKLRNFLLLLILSIITSSCIYNKALDIRREIEMEKAKERHVLFIQNNDTILNYTTSSDTIIIKIN